MKFGRLGSRGREVPVVYVGDIAYDLSPLTHDLDGPFFERGGMDEARTGVEAGTLSEFDSEGQRIGAPIARPGAVICIGMNYAAHAAESGSAPPAVPIMFLKPPNTVVGPHDSVDIPRASLKTDWEVELGIVIGKSALYLESPARALDHIAGFVIANDVSEREFQLEISGGQWSKGKSAPGFSPVGPWLITPEDVDYTDLSLRSWVNGEPRQDSTTADLIFDVEFLVWHLSQFMSLEAGDLIMTGTPAGVALSGRFPYLSDGDVVELEIQGLGRQRQEFLGSH